MDSLRGNQELLPIAFEALSEPDNLDMGMLMFCHGMSNQVMNVRPVGCYCKAAMAM